MNNNDNKQSLCFYLFIKSKEENMHESMNIIVILKVFQECFISTFIVICNTYYIFQHLIMVIYSAVEPVIWKHKYGLKCCFQFEIRAKSFIKTNRLNIFDDKDTFFTKMVFPMFNCTPS